MNNTNGSQAPQSFAPITPERTEQSTISKNTGSAKKGSAGSFGAGLAVGIVICLAIGIAGGIVISNRASDIVNAIIESNREVTIVVNSSGSSDSTASDMSYSQIAEKVRPAVVCISVYNDTYGWGSNLYSEGSGFIFACDKSNAYVITNSHVVDDSSYSKYTITATVTDAKGETHNLVCRVIGIDTRTDLAVLSFDASGMELVIAELGCSSELSVGTEVVAIGNPGGIQFAGSVTNGIVSGVDRTIDSGDSAVKYIQTNAAINPGNSGGPLVDMNGRVIGINTAKIVAEGYEGLGFAIPIDTALPIVEQLIENGNVQRPSLGISCSTVSADMSEWYGVPAGLLIRSIDSRSTLDDAGIIVGDIITACSGIDIYSVSDLQAIIENYNVGDKVTLTVYRESTGEYLDFVIELIPSVG